MGYTKHIIKGVSWLTLFRVATRAVSYVRLAILARLLTPTEFGTADIALLVLSISEVFTETGINIFLIQQKKSIEKYIDTAWVVSIIRGFIIAGIIAGSSYFVVNFFNSPLSFTLLLIAAIVPIFRGFINPSVVLFVKELHFQKEFYFRTAIFCVEAIVSVVVAYLLHSPIAIIYGLICGAIFESIMSFFIIKPVPQFQFNSQIFKEILHSGKWLTATGIFNYLYHNADNIVVGRNLGAGSLGIYQRAYSISMLPITEVADTFSKVTLPVYVQFSDDMKRLRVAFLKTVIAVLLLIVPAGLIFYFFPQQVITILLGSQWLEAVVVLQVLAIFGVVRAIINISFSFFYSLGRQDIVTRLTFVSLLGLLVTIIPFVNQWGLVGAGMSALVGSLVTFPFLIYYLLKIMF